MLGEGARRFCKTWSIAMPVAPSSTPNQIDEPRIEASLSQDACRAPISGHHFGSTKSMQCTAR
jgi:hypothetical protein